MRTRAKVDANQAEIVKALRSIGASVQPIHHVGKGCPDILVGLRGANHVIEIKDGSRPPSERRLTADEEQWHREWKGRVEVASSVLDAIAIVTGNHEKWAEIGTGGTKA